MPLAFPTTHAPVVYRQAATDANNSGKATVAALYVQDQIELSPQFQVIAGLRYDQFKATSATTATSTTSRPTTTSCRRAWA